MSGRAFILAGVFAVLLATSPSSGTAAESSFNGVVMGEIAKCWIPPDGPHAITVKFQLNRDGSLSGTPSAVKPQVSRASDAAVQAAFQAVRDCTPIALPPESYGYWRDVTLKFVKKASVPSVDGVVMREIAKCWTPTSPHVVAVRFRLNRDGSLLEGPIEVRAKLFGAPDSAVQAAFRAVRSCTPIVLPPESYDYWRDVTIKFVGTPQSRPSGSSPTR